MLVEEPQGEDSCGSEVKRVEFKVMSPLLASWSVGFDRMISSGEFIEAQMVITDFSSTAVELFLRFLYSGVVKGPLETLVEVCALADKYQVQGLNPGNACQLFAFAARYQLADLLRMVLEEIWINPEFCQHNPEPLECYVTSTTAPAPARASYPSMSWQLPFDEPHAREPLELPWHECLYISWNVKAFMPSSSGCWLM